MKKWLRRRIPSPRTILANRHLSVFGERLHDPSLWHLNRRSASGAFAVGLFVMFIPTVGQMAIAAAAAIALRVNLPISVALVWITNPVTMPPIFYFAYLVGARILGAPAIGFRLEFWADWHNWLAVLGPLSLGMLVCAVLCSAAGYFGVQALWRLSLLREIDRRKVRYRTMAQTPSVATTVVGLKTPSSKRQI